MFVFLALVLVRLTAMPGLETGNNSLFLEIPKRLSLLRHTHHLHQFNCQVVLYKSSGKGWEADGSLDQHDLRVTGIDWAPKTNR